MLKKKALILFLSFLLAISFSVVPAAAANGSGIQTAAASAKTIVPRPTITGLAKKASTMTVRWTRQTKKTAGSNISGYQVQIATDKKFTVNKQTKKITGYQTAKTTFKGLKKKNRLLQLV